MAKFQFRFQRQRDVHGEPRESDQLRVHLLKAVRYIAAFHPL